MSKILFFARKLIRDTLINSKLEIMDLFEYGKSKIEFMVMHNRGIISISLVDDLSYDFMVFNKDGDKILYSHTEELSLINELKELINQDINKISAECF